jgi:electron transfer flavoprotein beta subunit
MVCFKVVPEFEQVVDADWDDFSLSTDLGYVKRVLGCFDESALETALRLRTAWEAAGEKTECTALTASPLPSSLCKTLFAAGFDRVRDLSGTGVVEFQPRRTAALLGNCLKTTGFDLILAGRQAGYADTGMVPLLLAEALKVPVITEVEEIAPCAGGVEVKRVSDSGRERLRVRLPLLAVLGNSPISALRAATLSARMAVSKRSAETFPASVEADASLEVGVPVEAPRFSREKRRRVCRFLSGGADLAQSVAEIQAEYLRGWKR